MTSSLERLRYKQVNLKGFNNTTLNLLVMFLTKLLLSKAGWRPRSLGVPGRQWIGKNKRPRHVTRHMRKSQRQKEARIAEVKRMTEFSYLTQEEAEISPEEQEQLDAAIRTLAWQKRTKILRIRCTSAVGV